MSRVQNRDVIARRMTAAAAGAAAMCAWKEALGADPDEDDEADLADLLADLMHFAAINRISYPEGFDAGLERARMHFEAERRGEL